MAEITIAATLNNLDTVLSFVEQEMEAAGCSPKLMSKINMAVEEIFVNIAHYAYEPAEGSVYIRCDAENSPCRGTVVFADMGKPFNPLARADPDVGLDAERREIGGLGILMVKKLMDCVQYEYRDGQNILTLRKSE